MTYPMGRVVGRILRIEQGFPGDGGTPVEVPIPSARVTFHAEIPEHYREVLRLTDPTLMLVRDIVVETDDEGRIVNGVGDPWQDVPTNYDPDTGRPEWVWLVTVSSVMAPSRSWRVNIPPYAGGVVTDLSIAAHVPARPGAELWAWESLRMQVQGAVTQVGVALDAALADIDDAADGVEHRAVLAATAAAADYTTQAGSSATAAANAATAANTSAASAAASATAASTDAARAEAAADSIDVSVIEEKLSKKADLVTGKVPVAQLPTDTAPTPGTLLIRDGSGRVGVGSPSSAEHAVPRSYIDAMSTPYAPVELNTGFTSTEGFGISVVNGMVCVRGVATGSFPVGATQIVADGKIPDALRPKNGAAVPGAGYSASASVVTAYVTTGGGVTVVNQSGATRAWANIAVLYPVAGK